MAKIVDGMLEGTVGDKICYVVNGVQRVREKPKKMPNIAASFCTGFDKNITFFNFSRLILQFVSQKLLTLGKILCKKQTF